MPSRPCAAALQHLSGVIRSERVALTHLAGREGLSAEDAVDAVHDALCTLLERLRRSSEPIDRDDVVRLLAAMVRNAARNRRRRHYLARPHADLDAIAGDDAGAAEALVSEAEDHVRLRVCVARLCDNQRAVVTLRLLEEQPGEDVAASLGLARGHVDVLLHRAKASLRTCLDESA